MTGIKIHFFLTFDYSDVLTVRAAAISVDISQTTEEHRQTQNQK